MDWKTVKCTQCKSKKFCRRSNIAKGSKICQQNLKLIPKEKGEFSKHQASSAMLYGMYQKLKGEKK